MDKVSTHDYMGGEYTDEQHASFDQIRTKCKELETLLRSHRDTGKRTFSDRCLTVARTNLEACCMYAIKAVVFEGKEVE